MCWYQSVQGKHFYYLIEKTEEYDHYCNLSLICLIERIIVIEVYFFLSISLQSTMAKWSRDFFSWRPIKVQSVSHTKPWRLCREWEVFREWEKMGWVHKMAGKGCCSSQKPSNNTSSSLQLFLSDICTLWLRFFTAFWGHDGDQSLKCFHCCSFATIYSKGNVIFFPLVVSIQFPDKLSGHTCLDPEDKYS